jgi:hypothetical protein
MAFSDEQVEVYASFHEISLQTCKLLSYNTFYLMSLWTDRVFIPISSRILFFTLHTMV